MALTSYPKFGAQAGFVKTTQANRSDQAELQVGRHAEVLVKSTTKECSATKSDCSWGIEPSAISSPYLTVPQIILDSVRLTVEDEADPKYTAAQVDQYGDAVVVDPRKPLVKVLHGCCLVKRAKIGLSISGKGDPQIPLGSTDIPDPLKTAIGTLNIGTIINTPVTGLIAMGAVFRVQSYTVNDSDGDWQNFSCDYQAFVDGDAAGASIAFPLLTAANVMPPACPCPEGNEPSPYETTEKCCNTYRVEWSMTGTGYAEISGTATKHPMAAAVLPKP